MEDDDEGGGECPGGLPGWLATFADLMSLLMVFFVLLLSFSEMDVIKYKQVAGSLAAAFGIQRDIKNALDIPKGTSIISQNFSPGKPEPTVVNEIRQQTREDLQHHLKMNQAVEEQRDQERSDARAAEAERKADALAKTLRKEINEDRVEVQVAGDQVVIRILDKGSFGSATARISPVFAALILKISTALNQVEGGIQVIGHTDDIPIQTLEFPSNWVLSAARAAAVAHVMTQSGGIAPERLEIRAHASNQPLAPNTSPQTRATNRRVELVLAGGPETLPPGLFNPETPPP